MDTLHDGLAELAEDAPTGGAPAAELWARGKRAHRFRVAAVAAAVLVVGAVGAGIGVRVVDGDGDRSVPEPVGPVVVALPIEYPVGKELPDLGDAPGPLAGIWLTPQEGGGGVEAVGLVAETGRFGTLPIEVSSSYLTPDAYFALSPDGSRIAYDTPADEVVVRDLVTGDSSSLAFDSFQTRPADDGPYTWVDATHLVGHVAPEADPASIHQGGEGDGWVWQPGTEPKLVNLMTYPGTPYLAQNAGVYEHPWFLTLLPKGNPRTCLSIRDGMPVLCDLVGVIGPKIALTHDGDGAVVALDIKGVENPALRDLVATPGAPLRVTFATDLIGQSLGEGGGVS
jgi:hypothetical protein